MTGVQTCALPILKSNYADAYTNRGNIKFKLKDYKGSIADYTKSIELISNDGSIYLNRGLAKFYNGDKNGGCLDWSKAGELGEENVYDLIKKYCN